MKKIFLILVLLLLSGCSVDYNLSYIDDEIIENITLTVDNASQIEELKSNNIYAIADASSLIKYNINYERKKAIYSYTYSLDSFNRANYVNQCFDAFGFVKKNEFEYVLSTSKGFNCMNYSYIPVDGYTIKITTNHEVIESNADSVKRNEYTWNINNDNASNKAIYIHFGKVKERTILDWIYENLLSIIIIGSIFIIITTAVGYIVVKSKKNNEI